MVQPQEMVTSVFVADASIGSASRVMTFDATTLGVTAKADAVTDVSG